MATANATVDTDNFWNNAFTDFAPLLTLFGDETTKQFLATSTGLADTILLGIAPIGIMTIIVSAIRVGGNRLMRSIIGRARDSPDDEEKDILSSTSVNVREIWDGSRIIRQTGPPKTASFVFDPDLVKDAPGQSRQLSWERCLRRLLDEPVEVHQPPLYTIGGYQLVSGPSSKRIKYRKAPSNLTLNIPGTVSSPRIVGMAIASGILSQVGVIIANAVVVYWLKWLRAGKVVAAYGYPVWVAGTIAITVGICLCGWIVESSALKAVVRPLKHPYDETGKAPLRLVLYQKGMLEQGIQAYAIEFVPADEKVRLSFRQFPLTSEDFTSSEARLDKETSAKRRAWITTVGTVLALGGFICQNIGTRELHYSAGLLQLGATLLSTVLRAALRMKVGAMESNTGSENSTESPAVGDRSKITKLDSIFPSCHLVTHLIGYQCYMPIPRIMGSYSHGICEPIVHPPLDDWIQGSGSSTTRREITFSILQAHELLAGHEPDGYETTKWATACVGAINAIIKKVWEGKCNKPESPFIWVNLMIKSGDVADPGSEEKTTSHVVPISGDEIALVRAAIDLTRYAYMRGLESDGIINVDRSYMSRTLGYCHLGDRETYITLLDAWLEGPQEVNSSPATRQGRLSPGEAHVPTVFFSPKERHCEGETFHFGLHLDLDWVFDHTTPTEPDDSHARTETPDDQSDDGDALIELRMQAGEIRWKQPDYEAMAENIVIDLISSFILQTIRADKRFKTFAKFMAAENPGPVARCDELVDILVREGVCSSVKDARAIIVPLLIREGLLFHWPKGYKATRRHCPEEWEEWEKREERLWEWEWDDYQVKLKWPERKFDRKRYWPRFEKN